MEIIAFLRLTSCKRLDSKKLLRIGGLEKKKLRKENSRHDFSSTQHFADFAAATPDGGHFDAVTSARARC